MKGLGDLIEAIIPDIIKPKNCTKCQERKKALNEKVPFENKRILTRSKKKCPH